MALFTPSGPPSSSSLPPLADRLRPESLGEVLGSEGFEKEIARRLEEWARKKREVVRKPS